MKTNEPPQIRPVDDGQYELVSPWFYRLTLGRCGVMIEVPKGFKTDFGSVPRCLWWWMYPMDAHRGFLVHDFLYSRSAACSRFLADAVLREVMEKEQELTPFKRLLTFYAVRLFGSRHWQRR